MGYMDPANPLKYKGFSGDRANPLKYKGFFFLK